ncbi:MAG: hypothetical protein PQJ61_05010 [Spirochaetales bacterium]|uniref:Uncharacterized protein n=1 Tax=Candidatus Thalassospirochaeta sargassi TaxID=3119039 RepID=A0AAJ1IDY5_9SPIO|nr:hypothetical protein [Spirochaetales bacterium]
MRARMILIIIILPVIFLNSCRSDGPDGTDIADSLWVGTVETADGYDSYTVVFEFREGGDFIMGDPDDIIIYDEAIDQNFTWSMDENYITVTGWLGMYFAEYAYEYSTDGNTLFMILIRRNFFNETYEEIRTGDRIELSRDEVNDFQYYFSDDYYSAY